MSDKCCATEWLIEASGPGGDYWQACPMAARAASSYCTQHRYLDLYEEWAPDDDEPQQLTLTSLAGWDA